MKVYCSASQTVLNEFNRILRQENEEPYVIELGYIGDASRDCLLDTAWADANPNAPTSGADCPPDPPEFIVDSAYLVAELDYQLNTKQGDMIDGMFENGDITIQRANGMKRHNAALVERFRRLCARDGALHFPLFVAEIER